MAHGHDDADAIRNTRNTARFFTETRHIAWVLLVATVFWGIYGYASMPQRKDPDIPIRDAVALCYWPGASAEKIEQMVTRRMEEKIAENSKIERITSNTRTGVTAVYFRLQKGVPDVGKQFDDIKLKLDTLRDLPRGTSPIQFVKDFGDTATLMLTLASPRMGEVETGLRASAIRKALAAVRPADASGHAGTHPRAQRLKKGFHSCSASSSPSPSCSRPAPWPSCPPPPSLR